MTNPGTIVAALAGLLALASAPVVKAGDPVSVTVATDLSADARLAASSGIPLMLVVTREDCGYCELLRRSVLEPMLLSGEYENRVVMREVPIDGAADLVAFDGRPVSPFAVADRYDAFLTPVVLLVGPDGEELHERLLGISNEDFYLYYLDLAIERATASLQAGQPKGGAQGIDQSR